MKLEFQEEGHIYTVGGIRVPSVSEVTSCLSRMAYGEAPSEAMAIAADRGTAVHKATQELDEAGECTVTGDLSPFLEAYNKFLEDKKPKWDFIEFAVNNGMQYAGTLDRYGLLNNAHAIVDIKTTSSITRSVKALYTAAQNLYRMAIEDWLPVDKIYILQLKRDATYRLVELPIEDGLANACLAIYEATKKKERKRKE